MHEDQFWLLVSLKLSGEATEEELAALEAWLSRFPERRPQLETLRGLWKAQPMVQNSDSLNRHLQRLSAHRAEPATEPSPPPHRRSWLLRTMTRNPWTPLSVAASLAIVIVGLYLLTAKKRKQHNSENTVMTKPGSKSKIVLPDGSQVWLNADSRLTYDENFRGPNREVRLCGEAYFDIAKDKDHPFIIHATSIDVKVLGTSLNIRSYRNEKNTEAVLIKGSIEVSLHSNPDKKIILQPNQKIMVENRTEPATTGAQQTSVKKTAPEMVVAKAHFQQEDSIATEVLWLKNKLAFDQETLGDVAAKIERWYNVKVNILDDSLRLTEYSAVFEDESLSQVMEALRLTGKFKYSINRKEVTITRQ
jgi:ferric-dicitrate binding protein FerR (iron transport regulator)